LPGALVPGFFISGYPVAFFCENPRCPFHLPFAEPGEDANSVRAGYINYLAKRQIKSTWIGNPPASEFWHDAIIPLYSLSSACNQLQLAIVTGPPGVNTKYEFHGKVTRQSVVAVVEGKTVGGIFCDSCANVLGTLLDQLE
jgi:hypothetical protein